MALPRGALPGAVWRPAAEQAVRWYAGCLAGRALTAATYGDWTKGRDLTARVSSLRGATAVERLVTVWCEAILSEPPPHMHDGEFAGLNDLGQAPPGLWIAQVLAAAANRDRTLLPLLVNAVPAGELERHLDGLLAVAVAAVMARDDGFWP